MRKKKNSYFLLTLLIAVSYAIFIFFIFKSFVSLVIASVLAVISFILLIWLMAGMRPSEEIKKK